MRLANTANQIDAKRIRWRKRADLQAASLEFEGRPAWGIKDPVSLAYFEVTEEAYFVLSQLDGQRTIEDVRQSFHDRFRPRSLSEDELRGFVLQLVSQNLVVSDNLGYGRVLAAKTRAQQSREIWSKLSNLLAIRFRGFDPDRLLDSMLVWLGWLFTTPVLLMGLLLILSAVMLVTVQFDELRHRLPDAQAMLSIPNLALLSVLLATIKVLHEFGHGLTCKRFGGECHEMGLMLLVFTPTLYCNVSDIWMEKDKWKRIAVSVAGMWVEALIAAICTLLWWFSTPGLFHSLCLNLIFLCGVNTFLFNGNPLLRYDGYFALADWLEIPNLQQQAMTVVRSRFANWYCGFDETIGTDVSLRRELGLFAYGLASSIYRLMLSFLILWGLHRWLNPLGLGVMVQLLAVLTLGSILVTPVINAARFLQTPANRTRIRWPRFWLRSGITFGSLFLLVSIPLPCRVIAGALADDDAVQRVYVTIAGTLTDAVQIGQQINQGQVVARLEDPHLKSALTQLEGELSQQQMRLEQLERRRISESNMAQGIPTLREVVRDLEQQLTQRHRDAERLILRSPRSGTVLSPPRQRGFTKSGALSSWVGSPLEEQNRGSFLREGTTFCLIGSDDCRTAMLLVSQDNINLVKVGQRVRLLWNELSGEIQEGEIIELAGFDLDSLSRDAVTRLNLPARITSNGTVRLVGTWYQARVKLEEATVRLPHGSAGTAKILVEPQSLGHRLIRWLKQTFPL